MTHRPLAIGVDIGGTRTKVALLGAAGSVLRHVVVPTEASDDARPFLDILSEVIVDLLTPSLRGLGIAIAGVLDEDNHTIKFNPNTPALVGIDIPTWARRFGLPVNVEPDLIAPAVAEYLFGEGKGSKRFLAATIGTGLGAGVLVAGVALRFAGDTAGDNGHIILDPEGPACTAGCHGCAEAYVATPAIERAARRAQDGPWTTQHGDSLASAVIAAARRGDPVAVEIVTTIGGRLGQWLASLAPIFLPDRIALCGGVAEAGAPLLAASRARFEELVAPDYADCTLVLGRFGGLAGAIGAAGAFLVKET